MDVKKLKASVQLAEMRFTADPSEANKAVLDQANQLLESAPKPEVESAPKLEVEKNEQVSGEVLNDAQKGYLAFLKTVSDHQATLAIPEKDAKKAAPLPKPAPPVAIIPVPASIAVVVEIPKIIDETSGTADDSEEKKTEVGE